MKKIISGLFLILLITVFTGCGAKKMYYFNDYSSTLYSYEKNKNEKALLRHKHELEKIIKISNEKNVHVPPGIYAELGYINLKENKLEQAVIFFRAEADLYPESRLFMQRLIMGAEKRKNPAGDLADTSEKKPEKTQQ